MILNPSRSASNDWMHKYEFSSSKSEDDMPTKGY
jgi:hypothetical protein